MPSSAGYLITAIVATVVLFFALWWMFVTGGDESPWIPAGLAASVVLLVALSAREVVMRRRWTKHFLEHGVRDRSREVNSSARRHYSTTSLSSTLRSIQKQSVAADTSNLADSHLDVFHLCRDYLTSAEEALQSNNLPAEKRVALRSGLDRARILQKHHLLTWARESSRALTSEAQQRARTFDKIETANKAAQCLDSALEVYPAEPELVASKLALAEYIASIKVAHWVEMAERAAFKGHYRRAIERYKDALFYLTRETVNEEVRVTGEKKLRDEIAELQGRLRVTRKSKDGSAEDTRNGSEGD
jgi:tetratricopeptide (TPR) repeat protein